MYVFRETLYCKPGKVRSLVEKFKALGSVMEGIGFQPFRIYTDVSGERFWTLVLESEFETLNGAQEAEASIMSREDAQKVMAGYHDLVIEGRREIFRREA